MKKKQWVAVISVSALIAIALVSFFILKGKNGQDAGDAQEKISTDQGHVHGAPPVVTQPADEGEVLEEEAPTVDIPEDMQRLIGVKTAIVSVTPMSKTIRLTGRIEYNEQKLFTINTKLEGWIEKLYVDYTGRYLKKGEPMLEIYSPDLLAAQQDFINILAWKKQGGGTSSMDQMITGDLERLTDAARKRLRLWDISEEQIKQIERTGKPMRTLTISSPVSGYVVQRYAVRGMRVMAGEPLLDIADLSEVWVIAEVNEADAGLVKEGQQVTITVTGLPGRVFQSQIDYVYPSMNPETRTFKVRTTLKNQESILKPAMFATVELKANLGSRLAVPEESIMDTGERQIVYVDKGEGLFEPRTVTAGLRAGGMREIVFGLKAGEKVASSALFLIDSEAQLKGVTPAEAPAHQH
jgi:Cu(I)/Ag(I) efflux system membrane fusion protein